jgi:hypothetical protein
MSIIRTQTGASDFAIVHKHYIFDKNLSAKAKGILTYLFAHGDGWEAKQYDVERNMADGRESVRSGFRELKEKGYLTIKKVRGKNGKWDWFSTVYDKPVTMSENPHTENPYTGNPSTENPYTENPSLRSNKTLRKEEELNKKELNKNKKPSKSHSLSSKEVRELVEIWNQNRGTLPAVQKVNKKRESNLKLFAKTCESFEEAKEYFLLATLHCSKDENYLSNFYGLDSLLRESGSRVIEKAESYAAKHKKVSLGSESSTISQAKIDLVERQIEGIDPEDFFDIHGVTPDEYRKRELNA